MEAGICNVAYFGAKLRFCLAVAGDVQNLGLAGEALAQRFSGRDIMIVANLLLCDPQFFVTGIARETHGLSGF